MSEFSVVGKRVPLENAVEIVSGAAKYTVDIKLPGMLYGKMLRSPFSHARIIDIDTGRAEKLRGVKAVLTHRDVPRVRHRGVDEPLLGSSRPDQYIFDTKVRFFGEGVAAVAATNEYVAEEGLKLISVDYEVLPAVFDPEEAMKPGAPQIHEDAERNIAAYRKIERGNVEKGFKEADRVFEDRFRTSRVCHCCLETHACVAYFDGSGKLTMWISTQLPYTIRQVIAKVLGLPLNKVEIILPHVGGAFGGKLDAFQHEFVCALLAMKTGRPVKMVYDRVEEFCAGRTRHPAIIDLKVGVKNDGRLTAIQGKVILDTGAYASHGPGVTFLASAFLGGLYRCPNVKIEGYCVYTNNPIAGAFRGYGNPQATFARELIMDRIANELGLDPLEFRLKNFERAGDMHTYGFPITSCAIEECVKKGAQAIGWDRRKNLKKAEGIKRRGVGVACMVHQSSAYNFHSVVSSAAITCNENGTVNLLVGAADLGTGIKTALAQIVAEELGLRFEDINVTPTNTTITPMDEGSYGSRSTFVIGNAVIAAARDLKLKLLRRAAEIMKVNADNLECKEGAVFVKENPEKRISIAEVIHHCMFTFPAIVPIGVGSYQPSGQPPPYGAVFAEVEVDTETGLVKVSRVVSVQDVGKAINPSIVEGQIEGAIAQGLGYALTEELVIGKEGRPLNPTFLDYKLFTSTDMPDVQVILVESMDPIGPFGAKGVGEASLIPVAPAVANAIYDAIGVQIKELPITPERVLRALGKL